MQHYFTNSFKTKRLISLLWAMVLLSVMLAGCKQKTSQVKPPLPYLTDDANVLSETDRTKLIELLEAHNTTKHGRIFVLIIPRLPADKTLEAYAYEKINKTPLRPGERNDRILVLAAIQDRKMRIETSREVWEKLTDEEAAAIMQEQFAPQFRKMNYYQGLSDGVAAIIRQLTTE